MVPLHGVSEMRDSIADVAVMTDLYTGHVAFLNKVTLVILYDHDLFNLRVYSTIV